MGFGQAPRASRDAPGLLQDVPSFPLGQVLRWAAGRVTAGWLCPVQGGEVGDLHCSQTPVRGLPLGRELGGWAGLSLDGAELSSPRKEASGGERVPPKRHEEVTRTAGAQPSPYWGNHRWRGYEQRGETLGLLDFSS